MGACGAERLRFVSMLLTHPDYVTSVLGEGWIGGTLRPGVRRGWRPADRIEALAYLYRSWKLAE